MVYTMRLEEEEQAEKYLLLPGSNVRWFWLSFQDRRRTLNKACFRFDVCLTPPMSAANASITIFTLDSWFVRLSPTRQIRRTARARVPGWRAAGSPGPLRMSGRTNQMGGHTGASLTQWPLTECFWIRTDPNLSNKYWIFLFYFIKRSLKFVIFVISGS